MSGAFGDGRHEKRRTHRIVVKCGSCHEREGTIELAVSRLRRCQQCFKAMGLEQKHTRAVAPQPDIDGTRAVPTSQPFASVSGMAKGRTASEFKRKAAGGDA